MKSKFVDRQNNEQYIEKSRLSSTLLYGSIVGTLIVAIATRKSVSKVGSLYANSKGSRKLIKSFVKKNKIDMSEYEDRNFRTFNDFFTRKILPGKRPFSDDEDVLISVADSKLLYYKIGSNTEILIKGKTYTTKELLRDAKLADEYKDGVCLVFRLDVDDYHRYSFVDNGKVIGGKKINGILHTVGPIAFKRHKVFKQNQREYSILETENFDKVIQMEVGALLVGKIKNHDVKYFKRGEEKGYFLFGGSTVVLLFKKNTVKIDLDIVSNSSKDIETKVKLGETIGRRY